MYIFSARALATYRRRPLSSNVRRLSPAPGCLTTKTMQLLSFSRYPACGESRVARISSCKLWYVYDGRNAWHSTWVQRYGEGCMHTSRSTAEEYSERKRVNGSVFYLQEMPALQFDAEAGTLFVTQFNVRDALRDFYPFRRQPMASDEDGSSGGKPLITNLQVGETLRMVAACFESTSDHWSAEPPEDKPVVYLFLPHFGWKVIITCEGGSFVQSTVLPPEPIQSAPLRTFVSVPQGGGRPLGWRRTKTSMVKSGINCLINSLL